MIELQNVSKYYNETAAVEDLSFEIKEGETFGLVGPSGCGKTTTLKMINRLVECTSGKILINGRDIKSQNPQTLRRNIGYVIQDIGLFPHHSVEENISTVPRLLGWENRRIQSRSNELLQLVGLEPETFAGRKPDSLSGGQQQRVGFARALAADPPIILMDEPFGALDPITKQRIRREVSQLFKQINKTIVLVTHDVFEAFEMCDRLCLLNEGRLQQTGSPKQLLFNPANEFVDSFFATSRFELELLSVQLSDILKQKSGNLDLYWSPPKENREDKIRADKSLYKIIEEMEQKEQDNAAIIQRVDGKVIDSLSFSELINRFQRYKRSLKTGAGDG